MSWQKKGVIFSPANGASWMKSHAQVPTPLFIDGKIRVFFSSRPQPNISMTSFVDIDPVNPSIVSYVNHDSILPLGKPGTFDEHGIMPSFAVKNQNSIFLFYSGWSRSASVPYTNSTGLAISKDGGETFAKYSEGPILARNIHDPYSATSPCVLINESGWHMWYCSGTGWHKINDKYEHTYDIKYAYSKNGIEWQPTGDVAIKQNDTFEAITRPYVVSRADGYHMWFCYRGSRDFRNGVDSYKIGHAFSKDMKSWQRKDDTFELGCSEAGWDSKMVAYPAIVEIDNNVFLLYNGNGFGAEGFGYAQWNK